MKAHRTDGLSLTFGLLFAAFVVWWLLLGRVDVRLPALGWLVAGALILFGLLGLLGALRANRAAHEQAVPAPVSASPVSASPVSASPVSGSPVSGAPVSGSPASPAGGPAASVSPTGGPAASVSPTGGPAASVSPAAPPRYGEDDEPTLVQPVVEDEDREPPRDR